MSTERKKEPVSRERVNFVLSTQVIGRLREKSARDNVPMSRIIDAAVTAYLDPEKPAAVRSVKDGITLDHSLEFRLLMPYDTPRTDALVREILAFFPRSAVTTCFYTSSADREPVTGTKIETYFTMDQTEAFTECLTALGARADKADIQLLRDEQPIEL